MGTPKREKPRQVQYVEGDLIATVPDKLTVGEAETIFVPHVCNDAGVWGAGFVVPLAQKWPATREEYIKAFQNKKIARGTDHGQDVLKVAPFKLGETQIVEAVPGRVFVCNMIAQVAPGSERVPLKMDALEKCMGQVAEVVLADAQDFPVICAPLFGAGLAGGKWEEIESLISTYWLSAGIPVTVYYMKDRLPPGWTPPKA